MNTQLHDRPLAAAGYHSYRYKGLFGWIMIGADSVERALSEARRSTVDGMSDISRLQRWDGTKYVPVCEGQSQ